MDNKKPNVFPTQQNDAEKLYAYEQAKLQEANAIYQASTVRPDSDKAPQNYSVNGHVDAVEQMRRRTEYQLAMRNQNGDFNSEVKHPELAENAVNPGNSRPVVDQAQLRNEEQMRLRDEQLRKNQEQIRQYQINANKAVERNNYGENSALYEQPVQNNQQYQQNNQVNQFQQNTYQGNTQGSFQNDGYNQGQQNNYVPPVQPPAKPPVNNNYTQDFGKNPSNIDPYILELSQPNYNAPFDVIPLPSMGKLYRTKKPNIRLAYMTTADENILTSPNLLQSGEFLEILINRKMLEPDLRYKDLNVGDRNAIMLWLRATAYGEMYPVTLFDEKDVPFDTNINLNDLKTKTLNVDPDEDGLFTFKFPLCKATIKFKLLTCGDIDIIETMTENDKLNKLPIVKTNIYGLERSIVEVNGDRSRNTVKEFVNSLRIGDNKAFNEFVESIECGIDLNIDVRTPGGGSVKTFLPLNVNFFWPNIKL